MLGLHSITNTDKNSKSIVPHKIHSDKCQDRILVDYNLHHLRRLDKDTSQENLLDTKPLKRWYTTEVL